MRTSYQRQEFNENKLLSLSENDTIQCPKKYWNTLKSYMSSKTKCTSPPLHHKNTIVTDAREKAEIFNDYFISQTKLDESNTDLPSHYPSTATSLETIVVSDFDVFKVLINLDSSKATGPDGIGNRILKESAPSLSGPLSRLINKSIRCGMFPDCWKTAQVTAIHKKGSIYHCNNYRPISLLPCISKVFEKLVFDQVYTYLTNNNILSPAQSGFRPGDSTVRQLTSICHKIYQTLDNGDEVLSVFLDFKKAFDKVWHKGLIFKLEKVGIRGNLHLWFSSYLHDRKQFVVIKGSKSSLKTILAGVPQGSVLGPLLFLVFVNDIHVGLLSSVQLYADDTSLFKTVTNKNTRLAIRELNDDLDKVRRWTSQWLMELNTDKSVVLLISRKLNPSEVPPVIIGENPLEVVTSHKHLGVIINSRLSWSDHIDSCLDLASKRLNMLEPLKYKLPRSALQTIYFSYVRSLLEYADVIWGNCSVHYVNRLENIQIRAAHIVSGGKRRTSHADLYSELGWTKLSERRKNHKVILLHELLLKQTPSHLFQLLPPRNNNRQTRQTNDLRLQNFRFNTESFRNSTLPSAISIWNNLDNDVKKTNNISTFKRKIKAKYKRKSNPLYLLGKRKYQIIMAQMRLNFSDLNSHLFDKHCIPSPLCDCRQSDETVEHYFLECSRYDEQRNDLLSALYDLVAEYNIDFDINMVLNGSPTISNEDNVKLTQAVHDYIQGTQRF